MGHTRIPIKWSLAEVQYAYTGSLNEVHVDFLPALSSVLSECIMGVLIR